MSCACCALHSIQLILISEHTEQETAADRVIREAMRHVCYTSRNLAFLVIWHPGLSIYGSDFRACSHGMASYLWLDVMKGRIQECESVLLQRTPFV